MEYGARLAWPNCKCSAGLALPMDAACGGHEQCHDKGFGQSLATDQLRSLPITNRANGRAGIPPLLGLLTAGMV